LFIVSVIYTCYICSALWNKENGVCDIVNHAFDRKDMTYF
jgi:hypothetical protein